MNYTQTTSIDKSHQCNVKQKPDAKEYRLDDFICIKYKNRKRICVVRSQETGYN